MHFAFLEEVSDSFGDVEVVYDKDSRNCHKEMDSLFDNQSWSVDLHSAHNNWTDVAVSQMSFGYKWSHNCHQEPAHRQACFLIDNQNRSVNHHSTHNSKTAEFDSVNRMDIGSVTKKLFIDKRVSGQTLKSLMMTSTIFTQICRYHMIWWLVE